MVRLEVIALLIQAKGKQNFNSKMVRLEGVVPCKPLPRFVKFQFQDGTIRSEVEYTTCEGFNAISIPRWYD